MAFRGMEAKKIVITSYPIPISYEVAATRRASVETPPEIYTVHRGVEFLRPDVAIVSL